MWLGFIGAGLLKVAKDLSNVRVRYTRQLSFDYKGARYLIAFRHQIHGLRIEKPNGKLFDIQSLADAETFYKNPAASLKL
jgi:hypothetical protein